jgi:hypothetical protein
MTCVQKVTLKSMSFLRANSLVPRPGSIVPAIDMGTRPAHIPAPLRDRGNRIALP